MTFENCEIKRAVEFFMLRMSKREWSHEAKLAALEVFEPAICEGFETLGFEHPKSMAARAAMLARARLHLNH